MNGRAWTAEEDAFIRARPEWTAKELAREIGRSHEVVQKHRRQLGLSDTTGARKSRQPHFIGRRTIVAKTCTGCSLLLDAEWFSKRADGRPESRCRSCRSKQKTGIDPAAWTNAKQAMTVASADRNGEEWTDAEMSVIAREDLSLTEMAVTLRRSLAAVRVMRRRIGVARPNPRLGEPEQTWVIRPADKASA